jgi:NAD(P)-dependent dehydrogenase (short-subunit alcohol dehydrogenase family)
MAEPAGTVPGLAGRTVVIAGATSAAGAAASAALLRAGAAVIAVGRDTAKLDRLVSDVAAQTPEADAQRLRGEACDLGDEQAVRQLAQRVGAVDGVLHLVGGWRGGGGLAGQTDEDYRFLESSFTALRHVSRAFDDALRASPAARLAIVSSTTAARPLAGGANYAAVKAASEAWTRAVAQGFAKSARDADEPLRAASVIFRVTKLAGLEQTLADAFVRLWNDDPAAVNGTVIDLTPA